jgi:DNA polymerase-1
MSATKKTEKIDRKRLVILDTHAILHRAYHALPDFASSKGEPTGALYGLVTMLLRIAQELEPDFIAATLDLPHPTHRHIAYDKYKSHRPPTDDALISQLILSREILDAFGVARFEKEGFEADDLIGTIAEHMKKHHDVDVIIASGDMDTMQLIDDSRVRVFTLKKGLTDTVLYDEEGVIKRYGFAPALIADYKGLRGDPSDNIPGIKGIGEKTATILISQFGSIEEIYKTLEKHPEWLEKAGIKEGMMEKLKAGKEDAEFSKELATIRRDAPIHFELPEKEWRESINPKAVEDILSRFEFRSLVPRVRQLVAGISEHNVTETRIPGDELFDEVKEEVPEDEFRKIALAVSVLDSNIAEPTIEDIYRAGRSRKFDEAKKVILAEIEEKGLSTFVYEKIELPLMPILRQMERKGVCIDKKFLAKLSATYHEELQKLVKNIYAAAGEEFNINSPKQLGDILFDKLGLKPERQKKTAGGARSTRESELEKMRGMHPIIGEILQHRELSKLLGTYIDNLPTLLDEHNRVHTTFIQIGAATGRLATKNPGLQNIPIKTDLGRKLSETHLSQRRGMCLSPSTTRRSSCVLLRGSRVNQD